jgi:hypothetical protein
MDTRRRLQRFRRRAVARFLGFPNDGTWLKRNASAFHDAFGGQKIVAFQVLIKNMKNYIRALLFCPHI